MRILITGNNRGIGRAIEDHLATAFLSSYIYGTHRLAGDIYERDFDVSQEEDIHALVEWCRPIDVLINNAGILDTEEFGRLTMAGMERIMRVNFIGPLLLAQEAVGAGAKLIINIGSMYGVTGSYGQKPTYAASKAALHNATKSLARSLGPNCRVVAIAPGIIDTGIHNAQGGISKHGTGHSLVGRLGTELEVAQLVEQVIRNEYINGTVLELSGGR